MRACALACVVLGCGPGAPISSSSSSIVLDADEEHVWLTSPDDDAIVRLRTTDLVVDASVSIEGRPEGLAHFDGGLAVTLAGATEIAFVDPDREVRRVGVPCAGTHAIVASSSEVVVSCPNDDRVVGLDASDVRWVLEVPGRPTALALAGDRLAVTCARTGEVRVFDRDRTPIESTPLEVQRGHAATHADAIASVEGAFVASFQRVEHDGDRERPPERGGYGSVIDGEPRIEPRLSGPCGARYARFDGGARVFSGPSAIASAQGVLWVAHLYTDNVAVLRCGGDPLPRIASFRTGRGPRGIALSRDGRTAFVDVGFAHSVARLELPAGSSVEGPVLDPALERTREIGPTPLSEAALRGRALFADAVDTHLTPSGIVTCETCHPGGGEDGLSWFLHAVGVERKLRRTPPAWGAREGLLPLHWDGAIADGATLSSGTIRGLMEGDALLIDVGAMAAWMQEMPLPTPRPVPANEIAHVDNGRALFERADVGCALCHSGVLASDGLSHAVLGPSSDPDGELVQAQTPSLIGVRARPPYLHDGRAPSLRSVLRDHGAAHGSTASLTDEELDDLLSYLESL